MITQSPQPRRLFVRLLLIVISAIFGFVAGIAQIVAATIAQQRIDSLLAPVASASTPLPTPTPTPTRTPTPTSVPTASPMPTPTAWCKGVKPIISTPSEANYDVQAGDSVVGIAQKFDVTPQALIDANHALADAAKSLRKRLSEKFGSKLLT